METWIVEKVSLQDEVLIKFFYLRYVKTNRRSQLSQQQSPGWPGAGERKRRRRNAFPNFPAQTFASYLLSPRCWGRGPGRGASWIPQNLRRSGSPSASCFLAWEQQHSGQHPSQHIAAQLYTLLYFFDSLVFMTKMFHDILCQFLKTYINYRSVQVKCPLTSRSTAKM